MFAQWPRWKRVTAVLIVPALAIVGLLVVLSIDGYAYDNWHSVNHLRLIRQAWLTDGSPEPPQVERYVLASKSGTTFVYTATQVIQGQEYQGLFACRDYRGRTFVITRSGDLLTIRDSGKARLMKVHKTRAAAW